MVGLKSLYCSSFMMTFLSTFISHAKSFQFDIDLVSRSKHNDNSSMSFLCVSAMDSLEAADMERVRYSVKETVGAQHYLCTPEPNINHIYMFLTQEQTYLHIITSNEEPTQLTRFAYSDMIL